MSLFRRHFILITSCLFLALLAGSWGLYLRTQALLSNQLAHLAVQSLPSDGPTPTLTIQKTSARGWPFGAWRRLYGVSFHTHLNGADIVGATPMLRLGGNWLDWAHSLTTRTELPLQLPDSTILRMVRNGESLTLRLRKAKLRISKETLPCPPDARCHDHGTLPLYWAHFRIAELELASSRLSHSLMLNHPAGTIRFAPQSLSQPDPALQNRPLLSAAITARELTYPSSFLQNFRVEQVHAAFALLPGTGTTPLRLPPETDHATSSWPDIPLQLRLHELSATIHPVAPGKQNTPPPHLSLGGKLYVPAFSGILSVSLTNWQEPLHDLLQSSWIQRNVPIAMQGLLNDMMTSPRMLSLSSHPLTVSIPLDHGVPPGLSSDHFDHLQTLYSHFRQLAPHPQ
ncbi:hypothetical protein CPA55_04610 [Parasaccharibacter sp. TMW2.1885]|uniref:hypothetical protein n=1 Tax=Parasaccharibacter sp. TMW2.1885 TaxID=2039287 RepID=UPI00200A5DF0|nr:hypothetical protein [Parasaccharibacter sp. TMW2.1885]MCK8637035.1 hypothetical protein [Parasaccharibacter sp. TMW2.1885]